MSDEKRERVLHPTGGERLVKEADAEAADINRIMQRFVNHGIRPEMRGNATYGDFSSGLDYHDAMNRVVAAQADFDALPSFVRRECGNDPEVFLDMVQDPAKLEVLMELGLSKDESPESARSEGPQARGEVPGAPAPDTPEE